MTLRSSRPSTVFAAFLALLLFASVCAVGTPASAQDDPFVQNARVAPQPRIVGGDEVANGQYPFNGFMITGDYYCGSSLISPTWVLTAAHCVEGTSVSAIEIVLGRTNLNQNTGIRRDARQVIIHPFYQAGTFENDIAVVRIDPVTAIEPIAVATPSQASLYGGGTLATVTGWGLTTPDGEGTDTLNAVDVPVLTDMECLNRDVGDELSPRVQVCAGTSSEDSCNGDSGGPLFVNDNAGEPLQFGIVSWGYVCAGEDSAGVYTQVDAYEGWLSTIVFVATPPTMSVNVSCLNGDGLVSAMVMNTESVPATIDVSFGSLVRTVTIDGGESKRIAVSGRPDGDIDVVADNSGESVSETAAVDCDPEVVQVEVATSQRCLSENGLVTVTLVNIDDVSHDYEVLVGAVAPRNVTLAPQASATINVSGRPDGTLPIAVNRDGSGLFNMTMPIACDPAPAYEAFISASCLAGRGRIDVVLANIYQPIDASYAVTIGSLDPRERVLASQATTKVSATGRPNGTIRVDVTRDGSPVASVDRIVDC